MRPVIVLVIFVLAGCATKSPQEIAESGTVPNARPSNVARSTSAHVTQYELGTYRYPQGPGGENESAVLRVTRVPPHVAATSKPSHSPLAYDPLPPSAELKAELTAQRDITEQLRAMNAAVHATEKRVQEQYGLLRSHTEEVARLRQQLAAERARMRELEAQLQQRLQAVAAPAVASNPSPATTSTEGVKW